VQALVALVGATASPPFEPTSLAFWDLGHGLVAGYRIRPDGRYGAANVWRTVDGGRSWRVVRIGRGPLEVAAVRKGRAGWIAGPGGLVSTRNRGSTWQLVSRRAVAQPTFASARVGWSLVAATRDGGRRWHRLRHPCGSRIDLGGGALLSLASPRRGWIVCLDQPGAGQQGKAVYETRDGGETWLLRAACRYRVPCTGGLPGGGYGVALSFLADGRGWLGEARGGFYATEDGGAHWRPLPLGRPEVVEAHAVDRIDDRTGLALVYYSRRLAVTRDGGRSWSYVYSFRP
jgi:photosystem II stability/assembly factor-like uncharacterized protein